ncbi:MAG: PLP-dependent aspartate aminotransferase family protein [Nitrospirota bacterium]
MGNKRAGGTNTRCVHSGMREELTGGVNTPIYTSSSYRFPNPSGKAYYPRYFNLPNQSAAAEKLRALEGAEEALVQSSGMAAITATLLALLASGDHAVFQPDLYGGTHHFVATELHRFGMEASFARGRRAEDFQKQLRRNTRLLYLETPSNPLLNIVDLREIAAFSKEHGLISIVDNTFATPVNQRPIEHGIDVVLHSGTKYLSGHSDLNCGAIATSRDLMKTIRPVAVNHGGTLDAHACYLLERSMKTLGLRVDRQNANAMELALFLDAHPKVGKVHYPGLPGHEGHETAWRQMSGFGGMLSFELDMGKKEAGDVFKRLRVITPAVSLGGVESLICFPAETSHAKMTPEARKEAGISDTLVRLSVGIEDIEDLKQDLSEAL